MANIIIGLKSKQRRWDGNPNSNQPRNKTISNHHGDLEITKNSCGDTIIKDNTPMSEQTEKKQWLCNNLGANKISENPVMILRDKSKIER